MRGKAVATKKKPVVIGITPAYAGKRCRGSVPGSCTRDHPRLCGEKRQSNRKLEIPTGSPPPMRGKAQNGSKRRRVHRITPAYAGKSSGSWCQPLSDRDHPRLCGEKQHFFYFLVYTGGSPPPMRGKVLQSKKNHATGGITPAYAGKSCNRFRTSGSGGDHPRLCGEKPASSSLVMFQPGSPPPMRGKVWYNPW